MKQRLLLVDDDLKIATALNSLLGNDFEISVATKASEALKVLYTDAAQIKAILLDIGLPEVSGLELLWNIRKRYPDIPVVMLTGNSDYRVAVDSMRGGATDFVQKGTSEFADELRTRLDRAIAQQEVVSNARAWKEKAHETTKKFELIGESPNMLRLRQELFNIRESNITVLIIGQPGTGKENIARQLNLREDGRPRKFIEVNCAAFSKELIESELFGHEKGAFTGAMNKREGKFVAANGGDLFLDEIGELPFEMQAKLLRALETRTVVPIGSNAAVSFNARIICATNRDLAKEVALGRFREDLYYRIAGWKVEVPSLADRRVDIPSLATHLIGVLGFNGMKLSKSAIMKLQAHDWPGNVRALKNCLERSCMQAQIEKTPIIEPHMIQLETVRFRNEEDSGSLHIPLTEADVSPHAFDQHLALAEEAYLRASLPLVGWNKQKLAAKLQKSRVRLGARIEQLGIARDIK